MLYFSEGAGCQSCLYQMAAIEQHAADFRAANVPVLPIVMNSAAQIRADMAANHVTTPFLLDTDGTVSRAYGTGHVAAAPAMAAAVDGAHPGHAEDGEYLQEGDHDPEDLHPPGHWWR